MADNEQPDLIQTPTEQLLPEEGDETPVAPDLELASVDEMPEKGKFFENKRNVVMVAIAGVALFAALGAVTIGNKVGASNEKQQTPIENPSKPNQPTQTPAAEVTTTATPENKVDSHAASMEKYQSMDVDTFEKLPIDERLAYSEYLIDRVIKRGAYDKIYQTYQSSPCYISPAEASTNNSGQEIVDENLYAFQMAFLQYLPSEAKPSPLDLPNAQKVLSATFYEVGSGKVVTDIYLKNKAFLADQQHASGISNKRTVTETGSLKTGTSEIDGKKMKYREIAFTDVSDSKTNYIRYVYKQFTNYDGTSSSIWLIDAQTTESLSALKTLGSVH